jgi:hypothetical protein
MRFLGVYIKITETGRADNVLEIRALLQLLLSQLVCRYTEGILAKRVLAMNVDYL